MLNECIRGSIRRFGRTIQVIPPGDNVSIVVSKAFIQPLMSKARNYFDSECVEVGCVNFSEYLYLGPSEVRLDLYCPGTMVVSGNEKFYVKKARKVCFAEKIIYVWAILQEFKEED